MRVINVPAFILWLEVKLATCEYSLLPAAWKQKHQIKKTPHWVFRLFGSLTASHNPLIRKSAGFQNIESMWLTKIILCLRASPDRFYSELTFWLTILYLPLAGSGLKKRKFNIKNSPLFSDEFFIWQLPILPGRFQPSTFGVCELNFRVRHGNGCILTAIATISEGCSFKTI